MRSSPNMKSTQPTLIVLGAGRGSRFHGGGHKLERPLGGKPVFALTLGQALATGLPVKVVTTEPLLHLVLPQVARRDVLVLPDPQSDPRLGMGYSIATGVRASMDAAGWLLLPADMPLVGTATILRVAQDLPRHTVVYPMHQGRRGHPVGFRRPCEGALRALQGDEGARSVLRQWPAHLLDVDDEGAVWDVDTPERLEQAARRLR